MRQQLTFRLDGVSRTLELRQLLAVGYAGREQDEVRRHVDELEALGIAPPPQVPMLYPLLPVLATNCRDISIIGESSTPEVEVAVLHAPGGPFLTVANDQTDRALEATSVTLAKNVCPKVLGQKLWRVEEVRDHWDALELELCAGGRTLQKGRLAQLLAYDDLCAFVDRFAPPTDGRMFLSGTVPANEPPPAGDASFEMRLGDPVLGRVMTHAYHVHVLRDFV